MKDSAVKLLDDMRYLDGKDVYIYGTGDYSVRADRKTGQNQPLLKLQGITTRKISMLGNSEIG